MKALVRTLFLATALSMGIAGAFAQTSANNEPKQPKAGEQGPPATVGALQGTVGNKATSAEDVKRQTEGKPTMAQEAQKGDSGATYPDMTKHAPGTVGAAPGNNPSGGETARR